MRRDRNSGISALGSVWWWSALIEREIQVCHVSFGGGFTPVSKQRHWWITGEYTEQRPWSGHFPTYREQAPQQIYCACFILGLLKVWKNAFFGCCCVGPKQRVVLPWKISRFEIHFSPSTGRNERQKSGSAGLSPQLFIPVLSFLLHSSLSVAGAACLWPFFLACTAEKPWSNFAKGHGNFPASCPQKDVHDRMYLTTWEPIGDNREITKLQSCLKKKAKQLTQKLTHRHTWMASEYISSILSTLCQFSCTTQEHFWTHKKCHPRTVPFHNNNWELE